MKIAIIFVMGLLVLTTACSTTETNSEGSTLTVELASSGQTNNYATVHELRLLRDKEDEVNEEFFPNTILVDKGDTVRISMLTGKSSFISINNQAYGMKAGSFDFTPKENGEYYLVCEDCEEKATAIIRVV